MPPQPSDLVAFESDRSPDAYERLVDRLLASPAFGERYAQYWLDLARFAETDGYEHDKVRPDAWRYRDWVIAALNADLPYDDFIRLQLDGDEIDSNPKSQIPNSKLGSLSRGQVASMFCWPAPTCLTSTTSLSARHSLMNEMTATVGAVFLGLQLGCAQCHNHKYDPLSQADFYRLRAVFEPAVPSLKRDVPVNSLVNQASAIPARFWVRGDHKRPGLEVKPAFPRIASTSPLPLGEGGRRPGEGSGIDVSPAGRLALAAWLVRPDNPLTSRVLANRLWQWHFGRGLCPTPSDFGVMGGPVTHPELLDWLATELRDGGWGMKRMHRLIVSSATYRQATQHSDPANDLYSHFPRQRLPGETIRDAMLASAGLLTSERGGPGVMPPLPEELLGTLLKGQWTTSKRQADHYRRSVYVFARRNLRYPIFDAFDRPDGNATCPIRNRSTTAPQSLLLFNSEFSLLAARHLAGRTLMAEEPRDQRTEEPNGRDIDRLYSIALGRHPTAEEIATLEKFIAEQRARLATEGRSPDQLALPVPCPATVDPDAAAAFVDACLALLNTSEFIYVD